MIWKGISKASAPSTSRSSDGINFCWSLNQRRPNLKAAGHFGHLGAWSRLLARLLSAPINQTNYSNRLRIGRAGFICRQTSRCLNQKVSADTGSKCRMTTRRLRKPPAGSRMLLRHTRWLFTSANRETIALFGTFPRLPLRHGDRSNLVVRGPWSLRRLGAFAVSDPSIISILGKVLVLFSGLSCI